MNREEIISNLLYMKHSVKEDTVEDITINEAIKAIEQEPVMPVMYYPQVEGITPTVVEPCTDAISRANTIDEVSRIMLDHPLDGYEDGQLILKTIQNMPPVTPQPKMGKWIKHGTGHSIVYVCSRCGCVAPYADDSDEFIWHLSAYCLDCGSRMMQEVTDEID